METAAHYAELDNGNILKTGGCGTSAAYIYDVLAGTVTAAPPLAARRCFHTAVQFANDRILLIGGYINNDGSGDMRSTEFYAFRLDSDLDGMDDEWELANGLDPTRREDAVEDPDGDGHTNLQEFLAGTDPHDPLNVLKIQPPQIVGNTIRILFPTVLGKHYRVEKAVSSQPGTWSVVAPSINGTGGLVQVDDSINPASGLYRVLLLH